MAHFAKIDENNIVTNVIVIDDEKENRGQEYITNELGLDGVWLQTSYNSICGSHYNDDGVLSGEPHFRKNFAGLGYIYDEARDAFIPPRQEDSSAFLDEEKCIWILNEDAFFGIPTKPKPEEGPGENNDYFWNVKSHSWEVA